MFLSFFSGKLCDASARYERAIQEEPGEIGHHKVSLFHLLSLKNKPHHDQLQINLDHWV